MNEKQNLDLAEIAAHAKEPLKEGWTWVFYGDSITHGAAHTNGWRSFPEIFEERVRWEMQFQKDIVINTAYSGRTTVELLENYEKQVRFFAPKAVFIMIGMNDAQHFYEQKGHAEFEANLHKLVQMARKDGIIPILQTCNTILPGQKEETYRQRYEKLPEYMAAVRQVAAEEDVILVDHFAHWQKEVPEIFQLAHWLGEPIHPGARGHLEMARLLLKTIHLDHEQSPCCHPVGL